MNPAANDTDARIPALDGVRGLAILLVIVWHYFVIDTDPAPGSLLAALKAVLSLTFAGVDLFFVLSGFLIGGILLRHRQDGNFFAVFYLRRFARLMPIYLVVLIGYVVAAPWLRANGSEAAVWLADGKGALPVWSYVFYLQNVAAAHAGAWGGHWLSATWSLAVEEQFYLLAPVLIWLLPLRLVQPALATLIVVAPLARIAVSLGTGNGLPAYVLLPCRWDALAIGMLIAARIHHSDGDAWFRAHQATIVRALGIGSLALAVMVAEGQHGPLMPLLWSGFTIIGFVAGAVLLAALYVDHPLPRAIFLNPALAYLGRVSYGVYLLHQPVRGLVSLAYDGRPPVLDSWTAAGLAVVSLAITLALAELSWRYLEAPILALGRRARYRPATALVAA